MNQPMLMILAAVVLFVGIALVWWLAKRLTKPGTLRTLIRAFGIVGIAALVGVTSLTLAQSQEAASETETPAMIVSESATVSTGSLNVTLSAAGSLEPIEQQSLTFASSAPVTEILVQVGDVVHAGDVLARLDPTDAEAAVQQAELSLEQAQASLDSILAPASDLEIALAQANITLAQAQLYAASQGNSDADVEIARLQAELARNSLWQAQINRDVRVEQAEARGGMSWVDTQAANTSVNQAENQVTLADASYEDTANSEPSGSSLASANEQLLSAQAALESLQDGPSETEVRRAQINVQNAQLNLEEAQEALDQLTVTAPFDGIVVEQNLIVGVTPPAADALVLLDTSRYTIDLSIAEADMANVALDQPVDLEVQTYPDTDIRGAITKLDVTPTLSGQLVTYNAQVTLNPVTEVELRPGMSAIATVILESVSNVVVIPNRFIQTDSTTQETTVTVESEPGVYTSTPVTIGERNDEQSEIVSGLTPGQTIVLLTQESDATSSQQGQGGFIIPGGGGGFPGGGFSGGGGGGSRPSGGPPG